MNPLANMKAWGAAGETQTVHVNRATVKLLMLLPDMHFSASCCLFDRAATMFLGHCTFHPQYGLLSYSEILCPFTSTPTPPHPCLLSSSWPLVSRTSSCWSTRGPVGCRWRAGSSHRMQPSRATTQRHWELSGSSSVTTDCI